MDIQLAYRIQIDEIHLQFLSNYLFEQDFDAALEWVNTSLKELDDKTPLEVTREGNFSEVQDLIWRIYQ